MDNKYFIHVNIISKKVHDTKGQGDKELLKNIKLNIAEGSLVALVGAAGAGKTTLVDVIKGVNISGVTGSVTINGQNLLANPKRLVYMIYHTGSDYLLLPSFTVSEEVTEAAEFHLYDFNRKERKAKVNSIIEKFGMTEKARTRISECSGFEKRCVYCMMQMISDKSIYSMDEPDAGLDSESRKKLYTIFHNIAHTDDNPKTIICIVKDIGCLDLFDQVIVLRKFNDIGRLSFTGTPAEAKQYYGVDSFTDIFSKIKEDADGSMYLLGEE